MGTPPFDGDCLASTLTQRVEELFVCDHFSSQLDIQMVKAEKGRALLKMVVNKAQTNIHGGCHGGALWTLADMAFGAAGVHDGPILTVGSDLTFIRSVSAGATVWAEATEITRKGRTGTFHIVLAETYGDPDSVLAAGMFTGRWVEEKIVDAKASSKFGQAAEASVAPNESKLESRADESITERYESR